MLMQLLCYLTLLLLPLLLLLLLLLLLPPPLLSDTLRPAGPAEAAGRSKASHTPPPLHQQESPSTNAEDR
jgi:hypothetical protein